MFLFLAKALVISALVILSGIGGGVITSKISNLSPSPTPRDPRLVELENLEKEFPRLTSDWQFRIDFANFILSQKKQGVYKHARQSMLEFLNQPTSQPTTKKQENATIYPIQPTKIDNIVNDPDPIIQCDFGKCGKYSARTSECKNSQLICCEVFGSAYLLSYDKCVEYKTTEYQANNPTQDISAPYSTDYFPDYSETLNYFRDTQQDQTQLQQQLDQNWQSTQSVIDEAENKLTPTSSPSYNTWGEYYDAHPNVPRLHPNDAIYYP